MFKIVKLRRALCLGIVFAFFRQRRISLWLMVIIFLINTIGPLPAYAQQLRLPKSGGRVHLSAPVNPPLLKGIKVHPDNPFMFDFILDQGSRSVADAHKLKEESNRLIKYFLASLTTPEADLWVNLSPYEKNRIVPESFGQTEMGRDLLAQDYMLKQITASLMYPEEEIGRKFWKRIYEESAKRYGTTNIPVNTFNKVWIVPEKAVVYENAKAGTAYVVESRLKVMLEEDYVASKKVSDTFLKGRVDKKVSDTFLHSQIIREVVIPELTKEINEGANFVQLRQVYSSLILATWYKKKIKDSILAQVYADKNKTAGIQYVGAAARGRPQQNDVDPKKGQAQGPAPTDIELIYNQYLHAFKKGVYNYIKQDQDPISQQPISRKYFSGGADLALINNTSLRSTEVLQITSNPAMLTGLSKAFASLLRISISIIPYKPSEEVEVLIDQLKQSMASGETAADANGTNILRHRAEEFYMQIEEKWRKVNKIKSSPTNPAMISGTKSVKRLTRVSENLFTANHAMLAAPHDLEPYSPKRIKQTFNINTLLSFHLWKEGKEKGIAEINKVLNGIDANLKEGVLLKDYFPWIQSIIKQAFYGQELPHLWIFWELIWQRFPSLGSQALLETLFHLISFWKIKDEETTLDKDHNHWMVDFLYWEAQFKSVQHALNSGGGSSTGFIDWMKEQFNSSDPDIRHMARQIVTYLFMIRPQDAKSILSTPAMRRSLLEFMDQSDNVFSIKYEALFSNSHREEIDKPRIRLVLNTCLRWDGFQDSEFKELIERIKKKHRLSEFDYVETSTENSFKKPNVQKAQDLIGKYQQARMSQYVFEFTQKYNKDKHSLIDTLQRTGRMRRIEGFDQMSAEDLGKMFVIYHSDTKEPPLIMFLVGFNNGQGLFLGLEGVMEGMVTDAKTLNLGYFRFSHGLPLRMDETINHLMIVDDTDSLFNEEIFRDAAMSPGSLNLNELEVKAGTRPIFFTTSANPRQKFELIARKDMISSSQNPSTMLYVTLVPQGDQSISYPVALMTGLRKDDHDNFNLDWIVTLDYEAVLNKIRGFRYQQGTLLATMLQYILHEPKDEYRVQIKFLHAYLTSVLHLNSDIQIENFFKNAPVGLRKSGIANAMLEYLTSFIPVGSKIKLVLAHQESREALVTGVSLENTPFFRWFINAGYKFANPFRGTGGEYIMIKEKQVPFKTLWKDLDDPSIKKEDEDSAMTNFNKPLPSLNGRGHISFLFERADGSRVNFQFHPNGEVLRQSSMIQIREENEELQRVFEIIDQFVSLEGSKDFEKAKLKNVKPLGPAWTAFKKRRQYLRDMGVSYAQLLPKIDEMKNIVWHEYIFQTDIGIIKTRLGDKPISDEEFQTLSKKFDSYVQPNDQVVYECWKALLANRVRIKEKTRRDPYYMPQMFTKETFHIALPNGYKFEISKNKTILKGKSVQRYMSASDRLKLSLTELKEIDDVVLAVSNLVPDILEIWKAAYSSNAEAVKRGYGSYLDLPSIHTKFDKLLELRIPLNEKSTIIMLESGEIFIQRSDLIKEKNFNLADYVKAVEKALEDELVINGTDRPQTPKSFYERALLQRHSEDILPERAPRFIEYRNGRMLFVPLRDNREISVSADGLITVRMYSHKVDVDELLPLIEGVIKTPGVSSEIIDFWQEVKAKIYTYRQQGFLNADQIPHLEHEETPERINIFIPSQSGIDAVRINIKGTKYTVTSFQWEKISQQEMDVYYEVLERAVKTNPDLVSFFSEMYANWSDSLDEPEDNNSEDNSFDPRNRGGSDHFKTDALSAGVQIAAPSLPENDRVVHLRGMSIRDKKLLLATNNPARDKTMSPNTGGIDFAANKTPLEIKNSGEEVKFHIEPAMMQQLQNAAGFYPIIMNITPMKDIEGFLGVKSAVYSQS